MSCGYCQCSYCGCNFSEREEALIKEIESLKNELGLLRKLSMPMMHVAKGNYNSHYRGNKDALSYGQAGKMLIEYFAKPMRMEDGTIRCLTLSPS